MAKSALAFRVLEQAYVVNQNNSISLQVTLQVQYCDDSIPFTQQVSVNVLFASDATPQQIKTAMSDAIIDYGVNGGTMQQPITIAANEIILPDLSRG